jgi:Holliday junction resolvase RusA-like endonuclease
VAKKRRKRREAELKEEMRAEVDERGRRPFLAPVSVSITLFGHRTKAPTSVKAYLDCMRKIFYADDRTVHHLYVRAFTLRDPDEEERTDIDIEPLRMYVRNFDHAYSHSGGGFGRERDLDLRNEFERDELDELEREAAAEQRRGRGVLDEIDVELAESWRLERSEQIRRLRFRTLVSTHLYPHDRPGPHALVTPRDNGEVDLGWSEKELPGSIWLPLDGGSGWPEAVETEIKAHAGRWGVERVPIDFSLGLDLAVQGDRRGGKDLDNLAHVVTAAFRRALGMNDEDAVTNYRVYLGPGVRAGVRIRVVDASLLEAVHAEVFESRYRRLQVGDS